MKFGTLVRVFSIIVVALLAAHGCIPNKIAWKGVYLGQARSEAHQKIYAASEYRDTYCTTDLEQWRAESPAYITERISRPSNTCIMTENNWTVYSQCFLIGRPCSELIEVQLEDDMVSRIYVSWYFSP